MTRPRLLDLFCGAGGAAMGYHRAGFDVTGVDISPQPHYPFEFHQADALEILSELARKSWTLPGPMPDAIHASPPCQFKTQMAASHRSRGFDHRPDILTPVRALIRELAIPWVIENVPGARDMMQATLQLHGGMFGLGVHRPRLFESNVLILAPRSPLTKEPVGVYGDRPVKNRSTRLNGNMTGTRSEFRLARSLAEAQQVMGMDWGDWNGVREAIPPAYTEYIGRQLMAELTCIRRDEKQED
jgi:DNA (cytosine-5)-methyltransferase 1